MSNLGYIEPLDFYTDQVLGRGSLGTLTDNDEYFYGLARCLQPVPYAARLNWVTGSTIVWDGHILYEGDLPTLHYYISSGSSGVTLSLLIGEPDDWSNAETITTATDQTREGTYSMLTKPWTAGTLLRILCQASAGSSGTGDDVAVCRTPWLTDYGHPDVGNTLRFQSHDKFVNGNTGTAAQFNIIKNNDQYFWETRPRQHAFPGTRRRMDLATNGNAIVWAGYIHHWGHRLYYDLYLANNDSGKASLRLTYDSGGVNETYENFTSAGSDEGYIDINEASDSQYGVLKPVELRYYSTNPLPPPVDVDLYYLTLTTNATSDDASAVYTHQPEFSVGSFAQADGGLYEARIVHLMDNDIYIRDKMTSRARVGRRDYAVAAPYIQDAGNSSPGHAGEYKLFRRANTLYYRGTDLQMVWGGEAYTAALDDYDSSNPYQTLDLNSLPNLEYGQGYTIRGDADTKALLYAMEK